MPPRRTIQQKTSIEPDAAAHLRSLVMLAVQSPMPEQTLAEMLYQTGSTSRRHAAYARGLLDGALDPIGSTQ